MAIEFSESASLKVKALIEQEKDPSLMLRVYIYGGGCSGLQYGFSFENNAASDDHRAEKNGVTMVTDAISYQYLNDAKVDYLEDLQGSRFVIDNPNATTTCSCGSSFSI